MKIFIDQKEWPGKVNFVDENNVLVGYDMEQECCESADWFIADQPTEKIIERDSEPDMDGWVFDPSYFREINYIKSEDGDYNQLDEGGMVIFRLVKGKSEKFLHLYNVQNGYYGHGFGAKIKGELIREGII